MPISQPPRVQFIEEMKLQLGDALVETQLDPSHYNFALDRALLRYRQRSDNAMEESFIFLDVQPDKSDYTMPSEVQEVRALYRRSVGGTSGGGASIDPFSLAFTNNIYMLQNPGGLGTGPAGFLATYDIATQFQSLVGRMFGRDMMYLWNASTKILRLERKISATEQICVHVFNTKPEAVLLNDPYARIWLFDYAVANAMLILGQGRSSFTTIAGPAGQLSMNGSELIQRAEAEFTRLDAELSNFLDSHYGAPFLRG